MNQAWTSPDLAPLLIDEATKKSGLVWVATKGGTPSAVWLLWHAGAAYLLTGPGEQSCPGLDDSATALVTVRSKDKGPRLLTWEADVTELSAGSDEWSAIAPLLLAKRLNLPDLSTAADRWAAQCRIHALTPTGVLTEAPDSLPTGSLATPPPPSPAATDVPMPFTVGGSTRKRPRRER